MLWRGNRSGIRGGAQVLHLSACQSWYQIPTYPLHAHKSAQFHSQLIRYLTCFATLQQLRQKLQLYKDSRPTCKALSSAIAASKPDQTYTRRALNALSLMCAQLITQAYVRPMQDRRAQPSSTLCPQGKCTTSSSFSAKSRDTTQSDGCQKSRLISPRLFSQCSSKLRGRVMF